MHVGTHEGSTWARGHVGATGNTQRPEAEFQESIFSVLEGLMNTGKHFEVWTQVVRFVQQLSTSRSNCFLITNIQALEKPPWEVLSAVPIPWTFHKVGINGMWLDS